MHPTVKPVAMIADALAIAQSAADSCSTPSAAPGSTLIAAEKTGRARRLIELDPAYADVIVRRWQAFTGKPATLDGSDATFELVAERRAKPALAA